VPGARGSGCCSWGFPDRATYEGCRSRTQHQLADSKSM
jgi:hypothetical protein